MAWWRGAVQARVTRFAVLERFSHFTDLDVRLETGGTPDSGSHGVARYPVAGDHVYGAGRRGRRCGALRRPGAAPRRRLAFVHPVTQKRMQFASALPPRWRVFCLI